MTPQREAYLAKCGYRELWLRSQIKIHKEAIKKAKEKLENGVFDSSGQVAVCKSAMRANRWLIADFRHELNRLKGYDRGVVPKPVGYKELEWYCKCGEEVSDFDTYCTYCGKRLLWKKVK